MIVKNTSFLPHGNLYTRIKPSLKGVGVYAIRPIPAGMPLFVGDIGEIIRIPVSEVESLVELELRQMYYDFCPVVDGAYIAPVDFNQMTMGWYLNHSDHPNVKALDEMHFIASKEIATGEELTTDYCTYSEHAKQFFCEWHDIKTEGK